MTMTASSRTSASMICPLEIDPNSAYERCRATHSHPSSKTGRVLPLMPNPLASIDPSTANSVACFVLRVPRLHGAGRACTAWRATRSESVKGLGFAGMDLNG